MKTLLVLSLFCLSMPAFAEDSSEACQKRMESAAMDPSSKLNAKDTMGQLEEILATADTINDFTNLANTGIEQKMTWSEFKAYAQKTKSLSFADYHQPKYDRMYVKRYCGKMPTEAKAQVVSGLNVGRYDKTAFEPKAKKPEQTEAKAEPGSK